MQIFVRDQKVRTQRVTSLLRNKMHERFLLRNSSGAFADIEMGFNTEVRCGCLQGRSYNHMRRPSALRCLPDMLACLALTNKLYYNICRSQIVIDTSLLRHIASTYGYNCLMTILSERHV